MAKYCLMPALTKKNSYKNFLLGKITTSQSVAQAHREKSANYNACESHFPLIFQPMEKF